MSTKRILKTLAVMAVMLSLAVVPAMAESELDQSQTTIDNFWVMQEPDGQTLTAQKTGTLDKVSVVVGCEPSADPYFYMPCFNYAPALVVEIKGTQSDPPVALVSLNPGRQWYDVPLDPAPFVEAGKQYEIRLSTQDFTGYGVDLGGAGSDAYPGGEFSYWDGANWTAHNVFRDLAFQTYVTPDTTAPKVDAVIPAEGTEGVARTTNVTATFSEQMDPDTLNTTTFKLFKVNKNGATSRITDAPVKLSADGLTARLNPFGSSDTRLAKNTKYKAVVTTGAEDLAGNSLDQDDTTLGNQQKVWYFTT
jgi:hypothetical protein